MKPLYFKNEDVWVPLDTEHTHSDPFRHFKTWYEMAGTSGMYDPDVMILATCGNDHRPSARIVLLKQFNKNGFVFYTNYQSKKGQQIEQNPYGALLFAWDQIQKQIRIEGKLKKISDFQSDKYFRQRSRNSNLASRISPQSHEIPSREYLENLFRNESDRLKGKPVERPLFWGGYRLIPEVFEFWQKGESRLHDRYEYYRVNNKWKIRNLAP